MSDETAFLYRGLHAEHPAIEAARAGIVRPGKIDGSVTTVDHNIGGVSGQSPFTSWTRTLKVAQFHARQRGEGGLVLRVPYGGPGPDDNWAWVYSEDAYGEDEILLRGVRLYVEVMEE